MEKVDIFVYMSFDFKVWRAQKPSATFLEDNVAWEKTTIN
jgi:hypothetical protein